MPIPPAVLDDVKGSHGAPCTTKDAEDMLNVERANMHHGSLHMGQPAIFHRAINSRVLPESDKQQVTAEGQDMVARRNCKKVPDEVHWARDSEYSLGKEHLNAILSQAERNQYGSPGSKAYLQQPFAIEALMQHCNSDEDLLKLEGVKTLSYTHLTLPTILLL